MKDLFTEEQVEDLGKKVYDKLKININDHFYDELELYLYEIYYNSSNKIKRHLISMMAEEFLHSPMDYDFKTLRKQIFEENKEELTELLTEEGIEISVDKVLNNYTHMSHPFAWKYRENIGSWIIKNIEMFEDCPWVERVFTNILKRKDEEIKYLKEEVQELKEEVESVRADNLNY